MLNGEPPFIASETKRILEDIIQQNIEFPDFFSENAIDLIQKLLNPNPKLRLGSGATGIDEIKSHPFFEDINWRNVATKMSQPPYVPQILSDSDTSNFDKMFTGFHTVSRYPSQSKMGDSNGSNNAFYFNAFHGKCDL